MPITKKNSRKKVAIFFAGGTAIQTAEGIKTVKVKKDIRDWLSHLPGLPVLAETFGFFVSGEDQAVKAPDHWIKLAREIEYRINDFDGCVVIHDSASLIYAACAISLAVQNSPVPIVFTSSPGIKKIKPDPKTFTEFDQVGLQANLLNSVQVATMNTADISILDRNSLVRASSAQRVKLGKYKQIIAPLEARLGSIEFGVVLSKNCTRRPEESKMKFNPKFADQVVSVYLDFPQDIEKLEPEVKKQPEGLIIHGRGVNPFIKEVADRLNPKIPTMILASSDLVADPGLKAVVVTDMTREAATAKFYWALAQTSDPGKLQKIMDTDLAQEKINLA